MMPQKVQRFLVLDLAFQTCHSRILGEYFFDSLPWIIHFRSDPVDFGFDVVIGHVDFFLVGDVAQDQRTLHVTYCLLPLLSTDFPPIDVEPLWIDSLAGEIPPETLHPDLDLA